MGTDIHMYAEVRDDSGAWRLASRVVARHTAYPSFEKAGTVSGDRLMLEPVTRDRCYNLFAILANVRNGTGFAGTKTGEGFNVIAEPRGLPGDMCETLRNIAEPDFADYDDDRPFGPFGRFGDHSFSWLTLAEILAFDWTKTATLCGVVEAWEFSRWETCGRGRPSSWAGSVSGRFVRNVSHDEMRKHLAQFPGTWWEQKKAIESQADDALRYFTSIEWTETYAEAAGSWWEHAIPKLLRLHPDPSRVRVVFGFDS